jgi:PKHD-type hydroxylase
MRDAVKNINDQFFNYDLTEIQSLQFTSYDGKEAGFYGKHIDMMYTGAGTRKLSVSIQLSSGDDYEGGDLLLHTRDDPERPHRQQGTGIFFPGYTLHEVTPVTRGKRYSLVAWILGPRFK